MAPKAEPFVVTDFSGLEHLDRSSCRSISSFYVQTPVVILPEVIEIPISGIVQNGQPVAFQAHFERRDFGFNAEICVEAIEPQPSSKFAEFYLNLMLDMASLRHASPFQVLEVSEEDHKQRAPTTSAIMQHEDFDQSARLAFLYYSYEKDLTRSISWYRRGLSSPDPLLSFLGLWNSIEISASKFCEKNEKTTAGTKNQIYQAFLDFLKHKRSEIFSDETEMDDWIKENYQMRQDIAHGLASSNFATFERNEALIPRIKNIATVFLRMVADELRKQNSNIDQILKHANKGHLPFGVTPVNKRKSQPDGGINSEAAPQSDTP